MLPHNDLVLTVPMSADNLVDILGPGQIADLTACSSASDVGQQLVCSPLAGGSAHLLTAALLHNVNNDWGRTASSSTPNLTQCGFQHSTVMP